MVFLLNDSTVLDWPPLTERQTKIKYINNYKFNTQYLLGTAVTGDPIVVPDGAEPEDPGISEATSAEPLGRDPGWPEPGSDVGAYTEEPSEPIGAVVVSVPMTPTVVYDGPNVDSEPYVPVLKAPVLKAAVLYVVWYAPVWYGEEPDVAEPDVAELTGPVWNGLV